MSKKFIMRLKNSNIQIICAGDDGVHAEVKMARHLVKYYQCDNQNNTYFVATSKRPCYNCNIIIHNVIKIYFQHNIFTRKSSNLFFTYSKPKFFENSTFMDNLYNQEIRKAIDFDEKNILKRKH